jgi:hypothetical protein
MAGIEDHSACLDRRLRTDIIRSDDTETALNIRGHNSGRP